MQGNFEYSASFLDELEQSYDISKFSLFFIDLSPDLSSEPTSLFATTVPPLPEVNLLENYSLPAVNEVDLKNKNRLADLPENSNQEYQHYPKRQKTEQKSKHELRIEKNRVSAQKSRLNKETRKNQLESEFALQQEQNQLLINQVHYLRGYQQSLRENLTSIMHLINNNETLREEYSKISIPAKR